MKDREPRHDQSRTRSETGQGSRRFESGQNINPSSEAEIKRRIDQARLKITEHLKDVELDSPRLQAFADFADLCHAAYGNNSTDGMFAYNTALIAETIRQRKNGIKGYEREIMEALALAGDLGEALEGKWPGSEYANKNSKLFLTGELRGIKNDEITRKNHDPLHER